MRWAVLILMLVSGPALAEHADTITSDGPTWSQIAGWLGAGLAAMVGVWATRLETRINRETADREHALDALTRRVEKHIALADARTADMIGKAASNTLALSDLRLEMARTLQNHPTKSDFERGLDRLTVQVEALREKLDTIIAGQRNGT